MPRYIARIVSPLGRETFLCRGREVGNQKAATHHAHPSGARRALDRYLRKDRGLIYSDVIDPDDPERGSVA